MEQNKKLARTPYQAHKKPTSTSTTSVPARVAYEGIDDEEDWYALMEDEEAYYRYFYGDCYE